MSTGVAYGRPGPHNSGMEATQRTTGRALLTSWMRRETGWCELNAALTAAGLTEAQSEELSQELEAEAAAQRELERLELNARWERERGR